MKQDTKNAHFVQLNKHAMSAWRGLLKRSHLAAEILMFFIEKMDRHHNAVVCSYKTLMSLTGYSRPSVGRAIKALKEGNWIATVKIGSATAYCVNEKVAWQNGNDKRKYALFSASVIASAAEQTEPLDDIDLKRVPFVNRKELALDEHGDTHTQQDLLKSKN